MAKTREKLVEIARQLFARKGIEDTTMNDIAMASDKGRRTLYTYFKSKTEIYHAVVQSELDLLYRRLAEVVHQDLPADRKLMEFMYVRFESIKEVVFRNGTLRADFFRDIWRVQSVRRKFDMLEISHIQSILNEGIQTGLFEIEDPESMAVILHHALKGLEVPYIRGQMNSTTLDRSKSHSVETLLFHGIKKRL
ncbi:MAG: TetR family transcriptional regulator [Dysgonamonadaceae bacterium]|jgi:AcrR family transcriptional regulator|nr:TetR family transcriptional regulator [Dysgonamonadaceae bacterium]